MMRSPTNTSSQDPLLRLALLLGGVDGAIERQEAQGQRELIGSETLPMDLGRDDNAARGILEAAGVKFLGPVDGRSEWWSSEPDVGRVAYGIPSRVDRIRGLGNAVVPQVAEWIGRRLMESS